MSILLLGRAALAPAQLSISPLILEDKIYPGSFKNTTLMVTNSGKQSMRCQMSVTSMDVQANGLPIPTNEAIRSCRDWITLEPMEFALEPGDTKNIRCRIQSPKEVVGGYYALVSCLGIPQGAAGTQTTPQQKVNASVNMQYQVNTVAMLTVPGANLSAKLEPGPPALLLGEKKRGYIIQVPVKNTGVLHSKIAGQVQIKSESGKMVDQFELEAGRGFILPEHERVFTAQRPLNLPDGIFAAAIMLMDRGNRRPLQNVIPFMVKDGKPSLLDGTVKVAAGLIPDSAGFTVSPALVEAVVRPGTQRIQSVQISNLTKEAISLHALPLEWDRNSDGLDLVQEQAPGHGRSGRSLIQLRETDFEIPPMGSRRVVFNAAVPQGMSGEKYAAICFDRADRKLDASPAGRNRRSVRVKIQAQNAMNPSARITGLEATRKPNGAYTFLARLKNDGDCAVTPEIGFSVIRESGELLDQVSPEIPLTEVLAGETATATAEWKRILDPGKYSLRIDLRFSQNKPAVTQSGIFTVPAAK